MRYDTTLCRGRRIAVLRKRVIQSRWPETIDVLIQLGIFASQKSQSWSHRLNSMTNSCSDNASLFFLFSSRKRQTPYVRTRTPRASQSKDSIFTMITTCLQVLAALQASNEKGVFFESVSSAVTAVTLCSPITTTGHSHYATNSFSHQYHSFPHSALASHIFPIVTLLSATSQGLRNLCEALCCLIYFS